LSEDSLLLQILSSLSLAQAIKATFNEQEQRTRLKNFKKHMNFPLAEGKETPRKKFLQEKA